MRKSKYFGDAAFYKNTMSVMVPIMVQQGVSTFVNMLDNIMVGRVGTLPMSGVSISNQLLMIFQLAVFGANNAAGIFGAQFYGKKDHKGVRQCFHFKIMATLLFSALGAIILTVFGKQLIGLYLVAETNTAEEIALTLGYARQYMMIMLLGFPLFMLSHAFSSSIRETGETVIPMVSGMCAVFVNLIGNYLLIFGHFGFPRLGIAGAAWATVISRVVELLLVATLAARTPEKYWFIENGLKDFKIPFSLVKDIVKRGIPLIINEVMWSIGLAAIAQCYSTRGLNAVAAININNTIHNVFALANMASGNAISIMVGQRLGANRVEEAVDTDRKLIVFAAMLGTVMGLLLYVSAPVFPTFYNTGTEVMSTATQLLRISGVMLVVGTLYNACYHTLRSGGRTFITFLFDGAFTCCVTLPVAFVLTRFTTGDIVRVYLAVQFADVLKVILGLILVHKGIWVRNLVREV